MILPCTCPTATDAARFQNELYGKDRRVWTDGGPTSKTIRCSVCGATRDRKGVLAGEGR